MNLPEDKYDITVNPDGSGSFKLKVVDWSEWVPEDGQRYWMFSDHLSVIYDSWEGCRNDHARRAIGNCYPSVEALKAALPDICRAMQIIRACRLVDPDFVADWTDGQQRKYYIDVEHNTGVMVPEFTYWYQHAPAYVSTEEKARKVIEILERPGSDPVGMDVVEVGNDR